jgi:hypothetical protein
MSGNATHSRKHTCVGLQDEQVPARIETVVLTLKVRLARGRRVEVIKVKKEGGEVIRLLVGGENEEGMDDRGDDKSLLIIDRSLS